MNVIGESGGCEGVRVSCGGRPSRYGLPVALSAKPQRVTSQSASATIRRDSFE